MTPQNFIFFGIVGSGKGTQAKLLMDFLKKRDGRESVYIYPGDEYRRLITSDNYTGALIKDSVAQGHIQPGFLTDAIVTNILVSQLTADKHIITDGYPREITQSQNLEEVLEFYRRPGAQIICIELSQAEATRRNLKRGRHDDTEEGLAKRFEEYERKVIPAMNYFHGQTGYTIYNINGEQSVADVHRDVVKALGFE